MAADASDDRPRAPRRWARLAGAHAAAALLGYELAVHGLLPFGPFAAREGSTPLARLGLALTAPELSTTPADRATFEEDLETFRRAQHLARPDVVDLVVALHGLDTGHGTDWPAAERICKALAWRRCDRRALEVMKGLGTP